MTRRPAATGAPERQRIVVITTSYPTHPDDPSGHFVQAEVEILRRQGHDVKVLAPLPGDARPSTADVSWIPGAATFGFPGALSRLRTRPLRAGVGALRFVWHARRALAKLEPDRIIAHFLVPCAWPIATPRRATTHGSVLEVVAHGSDVRTVARLPHALRARIAQALAVAEVRCVSEELRRELESALGKTLRIRVEKSPLVLPLRASRSEARSALGVPSTEHLVVIVGRLIREKRVDSALRAARRVSGAKTVVIGDGPERHALAHDFPEARFVGHAPRSRALLWIAAADLLLSASQKEGAPTAVREARALGTPVLAVAAGDLETWSRDDPELWIVRAGETRCA